MNTRKPLLISSLLAALAIPALAPAAAPSHQCSQLWDDELRLTCYDKAFGKPVPPPADSAAAAPAASTNTAPAAVGAAAVVAATPPAAAPPAPVAAPAAAAAVPVPVPAPAKQPDSLATSVTALSFTLDGRFRATLENGQVWQQLELHPKVQVKAGDHVTLRKASFGSYQMVVPSGMTTRVTLLK